MQGLFERLCVCCVRTRVCAYVHAYWGEKVCATQSLILVWQPTAVSDAWLAGQLSAPLRSATEPQEAGGGKDELTR